MREADFDEFSAMLDAVCGLLSRGNYTPSAPNSALWFRALLSHDIASVRAAFDAHVKDPQRGRFVPVPADILAQIAATAADDGRPGSDEAWSIAVHGADEAATVVWTDEIAQAWGVARPIMAIGDEVGARMAFREAYMRILGEARAAARRVQWSASLGHDTEARDRALAEAARLGRIAAPPVGTDALPAPRAELLLPMPDVGASHGPNAEVRAMLLAVRDQLTASYNGPSMADLEREHTAALKAASDDAVAAYVASQAGRAA